MTFNFCTKEKSLTSSRMKLNGPGLGCTCMDNHPILEMKKLDVKTKSNIFDLVLCYFHLSHME